MSKKLNVEPVAPPELGGSVGPEVRVHPRDFARLYDGWACEFVPAGPGSDEQVVREHGCRVVCVVRVPGRRLRLGTVGVTS